MFVRGQSIFVVWDCFPQWTAEMVSQANGGGVNPCFTELLRVVFPWANGWITVEDEQGQSWNVNSARRMG